MLTVGGERSVMALAIGTGMTASASVSAAALLARVSFRAAVGLEVGILRGRVRRLFLGIRHPRAVLCLGPSLLGILSNPVLGLVRRR